MLPREGELTQGFIYPVYSHWVYEGWKCKKVGKCEGKSTLKMLAKR